MSMTACVIILYIAANLGLAIYHTYRDYRKGHHITLAHLIFLLTFGWWYTIPSLSYTWLSDKFDRAIRMMDEKIIIRSK